MSEGKACRHCEEYTYQTYDNNGMPPDCESYREHPWNEGEATAYQVYETVSEGRPLARILQRVGHARVAA
jgi:hypothetical protein